MRALIFILVGFLIGAVGAVMAVNALNKGSEFPRGVMAVEGAHFGALYKLAKENRCDAASVQKELLPMRIIATDIETSFKVDTENDQEFIRYAADLRRVLDLQLAKRIDNCADLNTGISAIKQACDNCHRDYK